MQRNDLSGPLQRIIERCQAVNFGTIIFGVRGGEPDLGQPWRTRRTIKIAGGENGPRAEADRANFQLRKEHMALVSELAGLRDGVQVTLEVKHGLPFVIEIEQDHEAA